MGWNGTEQMEFLCLGNNSVGVLYCANQIRYKSPASACVFAFVVFFV